MLRRCYPARFDRYIDPFVGSGAVFFDLYAAGRLSGRRVRLSDVNADLIGCYRTVRDDADAVVASLASLEEEHRERGAACYYAVRDRRFNPARAALASTAYTPALAAMFIYLNRTGFNGLFRLNRHGAFNVPAGRYTDPRICDADPSAPSPRRYRPTACRSNACRSKTCWRVRAPETSCIAIRRMLR